MGLKPATKLCVSNFTSHIDSHELESLVNPTVYLKSKNLSMRTIFVVIHQLTCSMYFTLFTC